MPSSDHEKAWLKFEKVLNLRTIFCTLFYMTRSITLIITGFKTIGNDSSTLLKDCLGEHNQAAAKTLKIIEPYAYALFICINVIRIILMLVSLKRPEVCKYYLYYQVLFIALEHTFSGDTTL